MGFWRFRTGDFGNLGSFLGPEKIFFPFAKEDEIS